MLFRRAFIPAVVFVCTQLSTPQVSSGGPSCQVLVRNFLHDPTHISSMQLGEPSKTSCWKIIESCNSRLNRLNFLVTGGNRSAAQYLAPHLRYLDAGNLEDSLIALGQFGDHDMKGLLMLRHSGELSSHEFSDSLTMAPESYTDRLGARLALLKARRHKVMQVMPPELEAEKSEALRYLEKSAHEIKSILSGVRQHSD